ncbi:Ig-like domain-containing protein [Paeniglutamicibacter sp. R2-26]|uniref:Ig-like domain-containing protein n=1 Tax=Paeniglutamicibacter sp. R2-26 TaxID=3144417 RepID=UPI003EE774F5
MTAILLGAGVLPVVGAPAAGAAPVGQGLTLNAGDMRFILKQIKIAENHATKEDAQGNPVAGQPLVGSGPNQIANALLPYGLRAVDGSENNLVPNQGHFGAASLAMPRLAPPQWRMATKIAPNGTSLGEGSYQSVNTSLSDAEPRFISNVIVDQTPSNPAAIAAAGKAHRTVNDGPTAVPCEAPGVPANCVPEGETLDIPNITTDFGLSPPYNGMFALFGQFFDHGVDFTKKTKNIVMVPLAADDPLVLEGKVPANQRFMILNRAENQPGPDGVLGTEDDVQDSTNTDSPWVDQSQTYGSHSSQQVFLREYKLFEGKPVSTGKMIEGAAGGMATWAGIKTQAASTLGLQLSDGDIADIPMLATDQYGRFLRGPNGLPQYVTTDNDLVEGNLATPVAPPANVQRIGIAFLDDIAHNANPFNGQTGAALTADANDTAGTPTSPMAAGTYDDEMLDIHFIAGDGRVNENIGLTAIHQVFHSEHNRLTGYMKDLLASLNLDLNEWKLANGEWNGERIFQAARFVTEMEYQHIVFEDFARKIQPGINPFNVFTQSDTGINPAIKAEFAHATYRFGHSMLTDTVDRTTNSGTDIGMPLLEAFLNPAAYNANGDATLSPEQAAGAIAMGMSDQVGAELDEFVTDTLRNNVLGLPLDLATLNIARGRDTGVPSLNNFRKELYRTSGESSLKPYTSWVDFGQGMKHPDSVVNFMAAYGTHPSIKGATTIDAKRAAAQLLFDMKPTDAATPVDAYDFVNSSGEWATTGGVSKTGVDGIDLWVGGLAESQNLFGGLLGSTFNYIFERQMTDLQDGDRLYYLSRTSGLNLRTQLEGNSFAELIMRNTDAKALKADVFAVADCEFELDNLGTGTAGSNAVADDPASVCDESALLMRMADGTIRYRVSNTVDRPGLNAQSTFNGTAGNDRIWGGIDNDTVWGNDGNDVVEGNDGADTVLGGEGRDIITDSHGDDVLKGGPGNDAIDAGPGLDIIMSGDGDDFSNGGLNGNEHFAAEGNDLVLAGDGPDTVFGGGGDDWEEGGNSNDLLQGDSGAPFFDDVNNPGHDVLIGDSGEDDYDAEGGDDVMVAGPGIERNHGVYGFDWVTHARSVERGDSDMRMIIVEGPNQLKDRFLLVEALSGWEKDDILRGNDVVPSEPDAEVAVPGASNVLSPEGIARIDGLRELLPPGTITFGEGNIIIGGSGSDQIWGNGADDVIDGDKWLNVRLSVRTDVNDPATQTRTATSLKELQADIMSGEIDPGKVAIVREILTSTGADLDVDTANFSGARSEYTITTAPDGVTTVVHSGGTGDDGTDRITNVEQLKFTDQTVVLNDTTSPTVTERTPAVDATNIAAGSNVTATFSEDVDGVDGTSVTLTDAAGTAIPAAVSYDSATRTATLNPNADLAGNTRYTVALANTIGDAKGNMLEATSWSFTIAGSAPTVTGRTPAADATNVAVGTNVTATFSEAVTGVGTGTMTLVNPAGDTIPAAVGYANGTATLNPNANLAFSTRYTVKLTNGIGIAGGTALVATEWSFTTAAAPVDPAPTLTARTPATNATNVAVGTNVTATFSETVTGTGSATMQLTGPNGAPLAATYSYNGATNTATLNPNANLATGTRYTVSLTNGIQDGGGNALAATSWSFTTDAAPTVTSRTPGTDATNVSRTGNISATFSEAVTGANGTNVRLTSPSGATVTAVVTYNALNRTVTLNPVATLAANTRYTVRLSGGIRDLGGNALATTTWSFTTDAVPTVTGRTPAANATNVSRTGNISATFSEAVTGANGTNIRLTSPSGATVGAVVTYNSASRTATLNPSATLAANTRYTVRLSSGIRDAGGNSLAATTWSFTTDPVPTIARQTPGANATSVSRSGNVTVQFSEAVSGVNSGSVRLTTSSGSTVSAVVSYKASTRTATINPRSQLAANTRYTVKVSSSIKDSRSNKLTAKSWNFRTGAR